MYLVKFKGYGLSDKQKKISERIYDLIKDYAKSDEAHEDFHEKVRFLLNDPSLGTEEVQEEKAKMFTSHLKYLRSCDGNKFNIKFDQNKLIEYLIQLHPAVRSGWVACFKVKEEVLSTIDLDNKDLEVAEEDLVCTTMYKIPEELLG